MRRARPVVISSEAPSIAAESRPTQAKSQALRSALSGTVAGDGAHAQLPLPAGEGERPDVAERRRVSLSQPGAPPSGAARRRGVGVDEAKPQVARHLAGAGWRAGRPWSSVTKTTPRTRAAPLGRRRGSRRRRSPGRPPMPRRASPVGRLGQAKAGASPPAGRSRPRCRIAARGRRDRQAVDARARRRCPAAGSIRRTANTSRVGPRAAWPASADRDVARRGRRRGSRPGPRHARGLEGRHVVAPDPLAPAHRAAPTPRSSQRSVASVHLGSRRALRRSRRRRAAPRARAAAPRAGWRGPAMRPRRRARSRRAGARSFQRVDWTMPSTRKASTNVIVSPTGSRRGAQSARGRPISVRTIGATISMPSESPSHQVEPRAASSLALGDDAAGAAARPSRRRRGRGCVGGARTPGRRRCRAARSASAAGARSAAPASRRPPPAATAPTAMHERHGDDRRAVPAGEPVARPAPAPARRAPTPTSMRPP